MRNAEKAKEAYQNFAKLPPSLQAGVDKQVSKS